MVQKTGVNTARTLYISSVCLWLMLPRPTAARLRARSFADFLPELFWQIFYLRLVCWIFSQLILRILWRFFYRILIHQTCHYWLCQSLTNAALFVPGLFLKLRIFADYLYLLLISLGGKYSIQYRELIKEKEAGEGGCVLRVHEPKKTGCAQYMDTSLVKNINCRNRKWSRLCILLKVSQKRWKLLFTSLSIPWLCIIFRDIKKKIRIPNIKTTLLVILPYTYSVQLQICHWLTCAALHSPQRSRQKSSGLAVWCRTAIAKFNNTADQNLVIADHNLGKADYTYSCP